MFKIPLNEEKEEVVTIDGFPPARSQDVLSNEIIAVLGYGVQERTQSLNLRENGFNIIIGIEWNDPIWNKAGSEGWEDGKNLFSVEGACDRATFVCHSLSEGGNIGWWPVIKKRLFGGKAFCFSHASSFYNDNSDVVFPLDIDVIILSSKKFGGNVRGLFAKGGETAVGYSILQNFSGQAEEKAMAYGIAIGSKYLLKR